LDTVAFLQILAYGPLSRRASVLSLVNYTGHPKDLLSFSKVKCFCD